MPSVKYLGLSGYEKSREDIFSRYDESKAARADQYLYFLVCNTLDQSTTLTDEQKLSNEISDAGNPSPRPGAETRPSPGPPPNPALPRSNPAQAAEQFMRLGLNPSSTVDDVIGLYHVPYCGDVILSNADDLRLYLESKNNDNDIGRTIVGVVDTQLISEIDVNGLRWSNHDIAAKRKIAQCVRNGIASLLDHMVSVCVKMVDLKKEALVEVIVDRKSKLIKLFAFSASTCNL